MNVYRHGYKICYPKYKKRAFISKLPHSAKVLDVGCGNSSPTETKKLRKDIFYVGIDVCDYNIQNMDREVADEYVICEPELFSKTIKSYGPIFDAVISNHNIEHCNQPQDSLIAICNVLKKNGLLYLAFPTEKSFLFPSREGTLNFYDDNSHVWLPKWNEIMRILSDQNMDILYAKKRFRPPVQFIIGLLVEPLSRINGKVYAGTWSLYGFESIIWAKKRE